MRLSEEARAIVREAAIETLTERPTPASVLSDIRALAGDVATAEAAVAFGAFMVELTHFLEGFQASLVTDQPADELTAVGSD